MAKTITDNNYNEFIQSGVCLLDAYADWCAPCRMMSPVVESISEEYPDTLNIGKINIDSNPEVVGKLKIRSIPTFFIFKDGNLEETFTGVFSKANIIEKLKKYKDLD
jgi:thioredoxin 1